MDARALVSGLFGAGIGAAVCYRLVRRDWLGAGGVLSIGTAGMLGMVTAGNRSHAEHSAVFAGSICLILCFAITAAVRQRRLQSARPRAARGNCPADE
jgi:hypothetical protein